MEAEGWTDQFLKDLRRAPGLASLKQIDFHFAKVDWELGQISEDMLNEARQSSLFLAVLAEGSVSQSQSRFFGLEMKSFRESGPVNGRFCPIPLFPLTGHQLSKLMPLENEQAFWNKKLEFFYIEDGIPLWLRPGSEDYSKRVEMASWYLRHRLDDLIARQAALQRSEEKGPFAGKAVLLSHSEPDMQREWKEIRELLRNDGVTILGQDEVGFAADLPKAILFVQILSPLDATDRAKSQLRVVESLESIPILQWRKYINPKLLERMDEDDKRLFAGPHVLVCGLEEFKRTIRERLKQLMKAPPPPSKHEKPYLYITADEPDLGFARKLQATARKKTDADIMETNEENRRADFEEGLKQAAGMVFLYGDAERYFIDRWLKEYVRKTRYLKVHPKVAVLYQAPPKKKAEQEPLVPFDELRTVGSQDEFSLDAIEQICAELNRDHA
jgi:hypothetical protein